MNDYLLVIEERDEEGSVTEEKRRNQMYECLSCVLQMYNSFKINSIYSNRLDETNPQLRRGGNVINKIKKRQKNFGKMGIVKEIDGPWWKLKTTHPLSWSWQVGPSAHHPAQVGAPSHFNSKLQYPTTYLTVLFIFYFSTILFLLSFLLSITVFFLLLNFKLCCGCSCSLFASSPN